MQSLYQERKEEVVEDAESKQGNGDRKVQGQGESAVSAQGFSPRDVTGIGAVAVAGGHNRGPLLVIRGEALPRSWIADTESTFLSSIPVSHIPLYNSLYKPSSIQRACGVGVSACLTSGVDSDLGRQMGKGRTGRAGRRLWEVKGGLHDFLNASMDSGAELGRGTPFLTLSPGIVPTDKRLSKGGGGGGGGLGPYAEVPYTVLRVQVEVDVEAEVEVMAGDESDSTSAISMAVDAAAVGGITVPVTVSGDADGDAVCGMKRKNPMSVEGSTVRLSLPKGSALGALCPRDTPTPTPAPTPVITRTSTPVPVPDLIPILGPSSADIAPENKNLIDDSGEFFVFGGIAVIPYTDMMSCLSVDNLNGNEE